MRRGSGCSCVRKALDKTESRERKTELDRMAAMLSRLGGRGYCVKEDSEAYGVGEIDPDSDSDFDPDFDPDFRNPVLEDPAFRAAKPELGIPRRAEQKLGNEPKT